MASQEHQQRDHQARLPTECSMTIFLYFSPITLLVYLALPHAYLLDIATSFMLKNQLHATATDVSTFRLLTAIPVYFSFVFGFTRDLWNPFGRKDRGFFLLFAPITAAIFLWVSASQITYRPALHRHAARDVLLPLCRRGLPRLCSRSWARNS